METEGREVQSLAHGGSEGQRLCSARVPRARTAGSGAQSGGDPARGLQPRRSPRGHHRALLAFHYHIRSQRPARCHQEGGRKDTTAARDRPEPEPAAADTYLARQSAPAETTPRGAPAHAHSSNSRAPPPCQPFPFRKPPLGPKDRLIFCLRITGPSLSASFLLTP